MKLFFNTIILLFCICILFGCSDTVNNGSENCLNNEIIVTELEVQTSLNQSYFRELTFKSIKANSSNIKVVAILNSHQYEILGEVNNFSLTEGVQELKENPNGKIYEEGLLYTTYHIGNGQTSYPVKPEGTLYINSINKECNTISGTVSIRAYAYSNLLNRDIRSSISFSFNNLPLDNKLHQL